ncbi:MAG: glycosyltransferase family 4 protein [Bacteroidia bacterium]|nr:glycosyltransferase family 4 protein [Bacteroidia bacterium]
MKILYILLANTTGGVEKIVHISTQELQKKGHRVEILFLTNKLKNSSIFDNATVPVNYLNGNNFSRIINFARIAKHYDVLHNHTFGLASLLVWMVSILIKKPLITTLHSTFGLSTMSGSLKPAKGNKLFLLYRVMDWLFRFLGKKVIAVSPYVSEVLSSSIGIRKERIVVIKNVTDKPPTLILPITNRPKNIIVLGRLAPEKQIDLIINMWARICKHQSKNEWMLTIVGMGEEYNYLKQLSINLNMSDKINFAGETNDIYFFLNKAQIAVSASKYEGAPLSILEFISCGIPIIASDIPAHRNMKIDTYGFLADTKNEDDFVRLITRLMDDTELRERLSMQALKESENYSIKAFIQQLEHVYKSILKQ